MKIARYLAHGQISYGAVEGNSVKELSAPPFGDFQITDHTHTLDEVKLLAPCVPSKILAIGLNYSSHLHDRPGPSEPMVFYKTPTSVIGPGETIIRPKDTERLDAEAELVVVIKDQCRNVSKEEALQHVLGYTCGNDVSARDWQRRDRNENNSDWWRAKSADTFSPMGPWIETDTDPHGQHLRTRVNGNEEQNETTNHLIFDVPTMIEFITKYVTLNAGDCIFTGTPGTTQDMGDGAVCEIDISGIGVLRNPVKLES
jgi:2-keto-4-pentenoate hydratase/2-oxohepta-3-ene-1,7-dioic acid hydratase in catechol pathway